MVSVFEACNSLRLDRGTYAYAGQGASEEVEDERKGQSHVGLIAIVLPLTCM